MKACTANSSISATRTTTDRVTGKTYLATWFSPGRWQECSFKGSHPPRRDQNIQSHLDGASHPKVT
jgi:hypothetical protein